MNLNFECLNVHMSHVIHVSDPWDMLNNFCFHVQAVKSKIQNLNFKFQNLQIKMVQVDPLDMLNKFCFHVYAQKSLFIGENCNVFFGTSSSPAPLTLEFIELVPS